MATYAVGDIHGCYKTLRALYDSLDFDRRRDELWLVGDLVNRGPRSLEVLRWARKMSRKLGPRMVTVLGNHDLHLLAADAGRGRRNHRGALRPILEAPDRDELIDWLRNRPLLHRDGDLVLVHAGLDPRWTPEKAERKARRAEKLVARRGRYRKLLAGELGAPGGAHERAARDLAVFTSIRTCTPKGRMCPHTGPPKTAPEGCFPWFEVAGRKSRKVTVVAGHWAALGLELRKRFVGLDTGCVYGGALSAIRLEDRRIFSEKNRDRG